MNSRQEWIIEQVSKVQINYRETCIPGTYVVEAMVPGMPMAVGTVWFRTIGNSTLEILQSYVMKDWRRKGIRTKINEFLLAWEDYDTIMTSSGSDEGGEAFLLASGYKKRVNGDWVLKNRKKRKSK